jgi:hypothetical protein
VPLVEQLMIKPQLYKQTGASILGLGLPKT